MDMDRTMMISVHELMDDMTLEASKVSKNQELDEPFLFFEMFPEDLLLFRF